LKNRSSKGATKKTRFTSAPGNSRELFILSGYIYTKFTNMRKLTWLTFFFFCSVAVFAQQDTSLQEYTGVYKFPDGSVVASVEIVVNNGSLLAKSSLGDAPMEKITKDTFSFPTYNGMGYFVRTAGKVTGIHIEAQDTILDGKKDSAALTDEQFIPAIRRKNAGTSLPDPVQ
jgi:hypothetical protein